MEDYKTLYEQRLERAKEEIKKCGYNKGRISMIENIFPELRESEYEKIRMDIIRYLKKTSPAIGENIEKMLAWLEKQGEKIDAIENLDTEFEKQVSHLIASAINKEHEYNQSYVKWTANALLNYAKHELEKQGEQKPTDKIQLGKKYKCVASPKYSTFMIGRVYKPEDKFLCSLMNFCSNCFEPIEDGEQKSTDKVEPKFKVGDTIVEKDLDEYDYETIKDIKDGQYIFTDGYCMNIDEQEGWQLVKTTINIEQKPVEWSAYDKATLEYIIEDIKELCDNETEEGRNAN